jgi:hypothetical protein
MKPSQVVPLTPEDSQIWLAVGLVAAYRHGMQCLWDWGEIADRRDAELMLRLQTMPALEGAPNIARLMWLLSRAYGHGIGTQPYDITYFA